MSDSQIVPVNEDKEIQEAKIEEAKKYYLTPKYMLWENYFFDRKNKETFGNATMSACRAYDLNPDDIKAYNVAANIGHKNVKKSKDLARKYWEAKGMTHGKFLDLYGDIMMGRRDVNLLYAMGKLMDVPLPKYEQITGPKIANQNNTQINASDVQIKFTAIEKK